MTSPHTASGRMLRSPQWPAVWLGSCNVHIGNVGSWVQSWVRKSPWRRKWQPTPVFLPGKFYGQRSLAGQFFTTESQRLGVCYASLNSRPCPHRPLQASSKISLLQRMLPHLPRQARSPVLSISSRSFSKKCHYSDYNLFTAVCHVPFCCESMKAAPVSLIPSDTPSMEPRKARLDSWVLSKHLLGEMTQRTP